STLDADAEHVEGREVVPYDVSSRSPKAVAVDMVRDTIKYLTNHVINRIPSYRLRYAWYRHVLGWHIGSKTTILLGLHVQMSGIRSSGRKVHIGKHCVLNYQCLLHVTGGLEIGDNVSIAPGAWLVTGSHDINDPLHRSIYRPIVIGD